MQLLDKVLVKIGHGLGLPSQYKLLKKIGAGAEGEVWLGLDENAQSMVAVKLIPRGAPAWKLDMARREFSMLAQLGPSHLNIVRPLEIVLTSKYLALITEYVPGGSLSDYLARHSVCEDVARYFFKQLLSAIAFCHARQMVYRDIKPANVLITGTQPPFLKLCDFGLADSWQGRPGPLFKSLVGTPGYMSPEIMASFFTGAAKLARRSRDAAAAAAAAAANAARKTPTASKAAATGSGGAGGSSSKGTAAAAAAAGAGSSSSSSVKKQRDLEATASGKLTSAVAAAAAAAAAAARAAVAAVPGSRSGSFGSSAAAATAADADAELVEVQSYDGEKADVYSLGVLLVVLMLRQMPWNYDTYAERLPLLKAMKALYDLAVGHRVSWRDATPKAETLSEPLAALLDRMLEPDPLKRATLQQVAESQWANLPLPRKLECALEVIAEQQELREQRFNTAVAAAATAAAGSNGSSSHSSGGFVVPDAVQQQLNDMIEAAKTVGKGFKLESRLVLSQVMLQQQQQHVPQAAEQQQQQQELPKLQQQQQQEQDLAKEAEERDESSEECCTAAIFTAPLPPGAAATAGAAAAACVSRKAGPEAPAVDVTVSVA